MLGKFLGALLPLIGLTLAVSSGLIAAENGPKGPPPQVEKTKQPTAKVKVYRLEHVEAAEVRVVLAHLLEPLPFPEMPAIPAGGFSMVGMFGMVGGGPPPDPFAGERRVNADPRINALIVRGQPNDLQLATDLISLLDLPAGKAAPKVKNLRAFTLQHADPDALQNLIADIELPARVMYLPAATMLIGAGPEDVMQELEVLIKALDVPEMKKDPEKKLKKLGVPKDLGA